MSLPADPRTHRSRNHWRRAAPRRSTPIADFVTGLRLAIAAFGQGELGTAPDLTERERADLAPFLAAPLTDRPPVSNRITYVGELSPASFATDLLSCASAWAERHPERSIELCWAGTGDLEGVLRAQWIPPNLVQTFVADDPAARLALFRDSLLLAVPNLGAVELPTLAQAMAAGLPVLGSVRSAPLRRVVTASVSGWLFNPLAPDSLRAAFDAALDTKPAALAEMRLAARRAVAALGAGSPHDPAATPWQWETDLLATSGPA